MDHLYMNIGARLEPKYNTSKCLALIGVVVCPFCNQKLSVDYTFCYTCSTDIEKFIIYNSDVPEELKPIKTK